MSSLAAVQAILRGVARQLAVLCVSHAPLHHATCRDARRNPGTAGAARLHRCATRALEANASGAIAASPLCLDSGSLMSKWSACTCTAQRCRQHAVDAGKAASARRESQRSIRSRLVAVRAPQRRCAADPEPYRFTCESRRKKQVYGKRSAHGGRRPTGLGPETEHSVPVHEVARQQAQGDTRAVTGAIQSVG